MYVTGTDTGIGKTHASCALLRSFALAGKRAIGMKPVASGCEMTAHGLRNDDALQLIAAGNVAEQVIGHPLPGKVHKAGSFKLRKARAV